MFTKIICEGFFVFSAMQGQVNVDLIVRPVDGGYLVDSKVYYNATAPDLTKQVFEFDWANQQLKQDQGVDYFVEAGQEADFAAQVVALMGVVLE